MTASYTISGFSIVRNGTLLDYPYIEAVESILPLCDEFILGCGKSDDDTLSRCQQLREKYPSKIRIVETEWSRQPQQGGSELKKQTDRVLSECKGNWCFYIQADEAVHEEDFPLILRAIEKAEKRPDVEGILFNYLHFYLSFDYTVRGRSWYRKEVRLFKNRRGICSFRDAQGFRRDGQRIKAIECGARIFHYGHVRSHASFSAKTQQLAPLWGETPRVSAESFRPRNHVGLERFSATHPRVLKNFIAAHPSDFDPSRLKRVWDKSELRSLVDIWTERLFSFRIGEFRNYQILT